MSEETVENPRPAIRAKPRPGVLLCSRIEDPGEKAFIEIVGQATALLPCVVDASGVTDIPVGDVVYVKPGDALSVALDLGIPFVTFMQHQVYLTIAQADLAGPVKRKFATPQSVKAAVDASQRESESAARARQIASGN